MSLLAADDRNADQVAYWNGPVGERWRARQQDQDTLLAPIAELLFERAARCKASRRNCKLPPQNPFALR